MHKFTTEKCILFILWLLCGFKCRLKLQIIFSLSLESTLVLLPRTRLHENYICTYVPNKIYTCIGSTGMYIRMYLLQPHRIAVDSHETVGPLALA